MADRLHVSPPIHFLVALVVMAALHHWAPGWQLIGGPARWIGLALALAGLALGLSSAGLFLRRGTPVKPFETPALLVTSGPFHLSRNPMYLALTIMLSGVAIFLGSLTPFLVIIVFVLVIDRTVISWEEQRLIGTFGESYREYQRHTRRWI